MPTFIKCCSYRTSDKMFRYKAEHIPAEYHMPADMGGLGYRIDEKDQIRMILYPDQPFHYKSSTDEHISEMRRELVDAQVRHEAEYRLMRAGLDKITLPLNTPVTEPHVPILVSQNLDVCERVIVYLGDSKHDLGILSMRTVGSETVAKGTAQKWVESVQNSEENLVKRPGIVIANPTQLIWHRRSKRIMSFRSWNSQPRPNLVATTPMHTEKNYVPGSYTAKDHIESALKEIVLPMVKRGCKVDIIGVDDGGANAVEFLDENWELFKDSANAMILCINSAIDLALQNEDFKNWFGKRVQAYVLYSDPFGAALRGRDILGCNVFSSQEDHTVEMIMPNHYQAFLNYFIMIANYPQFENLPIEIPKDPEPMGQWGENEGGDDVWSVPADDNTNNTCGDDEGQNDQEQELDNQQKDQDDQNEDNGEEIDRPELVGIDGELSATHITAPEEDLGFGDGDGSYLTSNWVDSKEEHIAEEEDHQLQTI